MALSWTPKQTTLARAENAATSARYASSRPWIISGLALSAGTGLNVAVSAGSAWIAGYYVEWDAATEQAVAASNTNHVFVELTRDMAGNVTAVAFDINTTGTPPSGDYIKLGTATTDGSGVTGTATTGRSPQNQGVTSVFGRDGAVVAAASDYDADQVDYNNTVSGMAATNVKTALDELAARPAGAVVLVGFVGQNVAVEANTVYLLEVVGVAVTTGAKDYTISVPSGTTALGYVEEIQPIARAGTLNIRGARNVSILTYTGLSATAIGSVKAYGKLEVGGTAGNLNLSVTNMDSYSYIKLTRL